MLTLLLTRKFSMNFVSTFTVYCCQIKSLHDPWCSTLVYTDIIDSKQDRQYTYNLMLRRFSVTTVAVEKAINITYSECVFVASGIHHETRMRHSVISGLPGSTIFSTLSHKRHDFRKKKGGLLNTKCVFWFSLQFLPGTFLILRRIRRDVIQNVRVFM